MSPLLGLATIVWGFGPVSLRLRSIDIHRVLAHLECLYLLVLRHCLVMPPQPCVDAEKYKCARYGENGLPLWSADNAVCIVTKKSRPGPYLSSQHEPVIGHKAIRQDTPDICAQPDGQKGQNQEGHGSAH